MVSVPFYSNILSHWSADIGVDLGTANTPVLVRGHGVVAREPSYVALDKARGKVIAVGHAAKRMDGKTPPHIVVIRPIRDGVISNFEVAAEMMKHLIRVSHAPGLMGPRVIIGVPSDATAVERRAVSEAARYARARRVYLVNQPLAAAIGAGLPVLSAHGNMVVDIGGGTSEVVVVALGGLVLARAIRIAGDEMDEAICNHVRREHNLLIGERTAENVKLSIGCALPVDESLVAQVRGRDLLSGMPAAVEVDSDEICEALEEPLKALVDQVRSALEATPPELVGDILDHGIVLAGGGARLRRLDEYIARRVGVKVRRAPDPESCVALGTDRLFADPRLMDAVFSHGMN